MTQVIFVRDPLTEEKIPVATLWDYDKELHFVVPSESKLYSKLQKEPVRYQNYPLFLDVAQETLLIQLTHIANFTITPEGIKICAWYDILSNLEFIKQIQYQRWLYPNEL